MRRPIVALALSCQALLLISNHAAAGEQIVTPLQTQSTSSAGTLVATDWGVGTNGVTNPLAFQQFNPTLGTLTGIDITMTANIRNDYILTFVATPIMTTLDVATSQTTDPSVLADPAKRSLLTDGPTVTLFAPNGTSQLFGPPATRQPVDFVQLTEKSGTWSSLLPTTNPNFIPPTVTSATFSRTLTDSNAPSLFSDFIGNGKVDLPVTASAFSSFYSSSGNGGGAVLTKANAIVTIQYIYTASIPEPASAIMLGLGIGISFVACTVRCRVTRPSGSDRA